MVSKNTKELYGPVFPASEILYFFLDSFEPG
jgi:hypothetical protein